jgi:hypothetical protein
MGKVIKLERFFQMGGRVYAKSPGLVIECAKRQSQGGKKKCVLFVETGVRCAVQVCLEL